MKKKKKNDIISKTPSVNNLMPRSLVDFDPDIVEAIRDTPERRCVVEKRKYSKDVQEMRAMAVQKTLQKKDYKEAIKRMKADGQEMEDIARKLGISTSYAYKLCRED